MGMGFDGDGGGGGTEMEMEMEMETGMETSSGWKSKLCGRECDADTSFGESFVSSFT